MTGVQTCALPISFAHNWAKENSCRQELTQLINSEAQRLRDIDICRMELEELAAANLKEQEDEELFAEYTVLSNAEDILHHAHEMLQAIAGEKGAALPLLTRHKNTFEQLLRLDASLAETAASYDSALIELQEVAHTLRNYSSRIEHNPAKTQAIQERLTLIERFKKRYGPALLDIKAYQTQTEKKLEKLECGDERIDELRREVELLSSENDTRAIKLTAQRKQISLKLEKAIVKELRVLNMPKVEFHCQVTSQPRSSNGDDRIEFFLSPNVGEHQISLKECASGGELSRVMLALQTLLAGKEQVPSIIFDEIDANIGGETAVIVGEKLKAIGKQHQVLCITHFPQVAKQADHHLQISKQEQNGRTVTLVQVLDPGMRQKELTRMVGGSN